MHNYRCNNCGAYLDPGEHCTCRDIHEKNIRLAEALLCEEKDGQMVLKEARRHGVHNWIR